MTSAGLRGDNGKSKRKDNPCCSEITADKRDVIVDTKERTSPSNSRNSSLHFFVDENHAKFPAGVHHLDQLRGDNARVEPVRQPGLYYS
jgi:hypothetical protein